MNALSLDSIIAHVLRTDLFRDLSPAQVKALMLLAEKVSFETGQPIIRDGEDGDSAFLILGGEAERLDGPGIGGSEMLPVGCLVGEMAMLVETTHSSTVLAHGTVQALQFRRSTIAELMRHDPSLAEHFIAQLTRRLATMAERLREVDTILAGQMPEPGAADDLLLTPPPPPPRGSPDYRPSLH